MPPRRAGAGAQLPARSAPLRRSPRPGCAGGRRWEAVPGRWLSPDGCCPRTEAVTSRRLSPDGQREPLAERAASPSQCAHLAGRREGRGVLQFWGRYQRPRPSPASPPRHGDTHARRAPPAAPQRGPPGPAAPAAAPRPLPRSAPGAAEAQEPPRRDGQRGSRPLLNGIFLPRTPPFYFLYPKLRAAPLEAGGSLGRGAPGSCGARRAGGAAVCQRRANVPKCHRCATDVPKCHRSVTDVPPGCRAPAGFSLRSPRSYRRDSPFF